MYVLFRESKRIHDLPVGHIDSEFARYVGVLLIVG
jgi:hypothetical protein